tara:strand:- start:84 stop:797 length:714 start_codon:yes stop_codon:yes gene_type:complete
MASSLSHTFDQASWRVIREFAGIYGVKLNYAKIKNLSRDKLSDAYFKEGKLPLITVQVSWSVNFDASGNSTWGKEAFKQLEATKSQTAKEWKATILKRAAQGYKNRQFYEALAKMLAPPAKVVCVCGLKMGSKPYQQDAHYRTRNHINRMLKCVPLSKVVESKVPARDDLLQRDLMSNSHTLVVRKWSNHQRQFLVKQIDLRLYMEQRERFNVSNHTGEFRHYTMEDILVGGWTITW